MEVSAMVWAKLGQENTWRRAQVFEIKIISGGKADKRPCANFTLRLQNHAMDMVSQKTVQISSFLET
eukprot:gene40076-52932_t